MRKIYYKIKDRISNLFKQPKIILFKVTDYERLEHDYSCVLCHATMSRMSKTNYQLSTIYNTIDEAQQDHYFHFIKDDINDIIKNGGTVEDIKIYINTLIQ